MASVSICHHQRAPSVRSFGKGSGFSRPQHAQGKAPAILEWLDRGGDFQHRIPHRRQAVAPLSLREQFRLYQARPVRERQKFHRLARDLMMRSLLDHQPAGHHRFADVLTEAGDGAIGVPDHLCKQLQRMPADRVTEQFGFGFQPLASRRRQSR